MGIYRNVYQPFGTFVQAPLDYQLDWPGIVDTAQRLGVEANQIATGAQPLAPGAGVLAPGASPEAPPLLQAPPAGTPGVGASTSPWLLIGGAALVYFVFLK